MDAIFEALIMAVLAVPGIVIRWVLHRGKVPLKKLAQDKEAGYNATYTVLLMIALIAFYQFVMKA
ncbi:hypothetical protein [Hymenobacter properus]|uniref:Uncharacterized protein n=1 Tax=Hymenobacter properus TaxID=2791026 RepID=A0A931BPJ0_9BACT|nr:hypothetical protein [Hymenobacter properus]MBF9143245.1 hypothetical protein [Hymenobacter properus]MBR7722055.1 hypothetical protein [Microvirga sp. SRT04]